MIRVVMSSTRLSTRIDEKVLHKQPVYKYSWIFWVGTILLGYENLRNTVVVCVTLAMGRGDVTRTPQVPRG